METDVFVQPNIASHLQANYVMVKIYASENEALAQRFDVTKVPTDIVMRPNGQLIHRRMGEITAERFSEYLVYLQNPNPSNRNMLPQPPPSFPPTTSAPFPASNPPGYPPPVAAQPGSMSQGIMPPREMISVPDVRDPFVDPFAGKQQFSPLQPAQQQAPIVAGTMQPSPDNRSFLPAETPARVALELGVPLNNVPNSPQVAPAVAVSEPTPPMVAPSTPAPSAVAAMTTVLEEPAPARMMVEVPLALEGFCPVTLSADERWASGNPAYCTMYQGHIFRFASFEALATFAQNPTNYMPVAMGEDVVLMVDRNKRVSGNREFGAWFNGRIFLFSSKATFDAFEVRPEYYMEIALKYETARKGPHGPVLY
jgi:protein disulfide-isomerase